MPRRPPKLYTVEPSDDPAKFDEAIAAFRRRVPMSDAQWTRLRELARQRAFKVAGVAQLDLLNQIWLLLDDAIARGATYEEFRVLAQPALGEAWQGSVTNPGARTETIFRTNVQTAYNVGAYAQRNDPVIRRRRPYWQYRAIKDARTSKFCKPLDGVVRPADDPWWNTHTPPLHHQCRSQVVPLTAEEARDEGITPEAPDLTPGEGFGLAPSEPDAGWEPDLSKYPAPLRAAAEKRLRGTP